MHSIFLVSCNLELSMFYGAGRGGVHGSSGAPVTRSGSGVPTALCTEIFYTDRPFGTVVHFMFSRTVECNVVLFRSWFSLCI